MNRKHLFILKHFGRLVNKIHKQITPILLPHAKLSNFPDTTRKQNRFQTQATNSQEAPQVTRKSYTILIEYAISSYSTIYIKGWGLVDFVDTVLFQIPLPNYNIKVQFQSSISKFNYKFQFQISILNAKCQFKISIMKGDVTRKKL